MKCPYCLEKIKKNTMIGFPVFDCSNHYFSTFKNGILVDYVAYWKNDNKLFKIRGSKSESYTEISSVKSFGTFDGEILFTSNCYFDIMDNKQPNPQKIITRLLNLKSFI